MANENCGGKVMNTCSRCLLLILLAAGPLAAAEHLAETDQQTGLELCRESVIERFGVSAGVRLDKGHEDASQEQVYLVSGYADVNGARPEVSFVCSMDSTGQTVHQTGSLLIDLTKLD